MSEKGRSIALRIHDMLGAIGRIESVLAQTDFKGFCDNFLFSNSVIRDLEVIGEASRQIPSQITDRFPQIPWQDIRDMRNILIHEYFGVDHGIVWKTAREDLGDLKKALETLSREINQ